MSSKKCTKCGKVLPLEAFRKDKRRKDGLQSHCKDCQNVAAKQYRKDNPEKVRASKKRYRQENSEKIKDYDKQYRKDNPEKIRESIKQWHEDNPEYRKEYYQDNKEHILEQQKQRRKDNPEYFKDKDRRYRQENPDKVKAKRHNRRARELNAPGHCTPEQLEARMAYCGYKCIYCGSDEDIQVDHIIPLARGGSQWPANQAPACGTCNRQKGTMSFLEFKAKKAKEAT